MDENSAPVVRLVHVMIPEAVQLRASDIHVEPFEDRVRIRYRIDGVLIERDSPPRRLLGAILSRIKILAKLDIAERRRPQDGRIKVTVGEKELDLRVSIIPTNHGQSVVMRLLDKDNIKVGVRQLGLSEDDFRKFQSLIRRPNGIILVTGPTGSGKTTTLYAALNYLNRPDRKIITAEDPVEYYLPGINQVEVQAQHRTRLRPHHPLHVAAGTEHHPGRRDARCRDRIDGNSGISDWTLGFQYTAYERCAQRRDTHGGHGCTRLSGGQQRDRGAWLSVWCGSSAAVQAVVHAAREQSWRRRGFRPEMAKNATFMKGKGCTYCQKKGLSRTAGDLRNDACARPRSAS